MNQFEEYLREMHEIRASGRAVKETWYYPAVKLSDSISGYALIKNWLSYRERELLGRSVSVDEACNLTETARHLATLMLIEPGAGRQLSGTPVKGARRW
jgi:hypothetical protein